MDYRRLEEIADACLERIRQEGVEAVDAICAEHPGSANDVRRILRNLVEVGLIGAAPQTDSELPRVLGDFRLEERLGAGGMGVVYAARQRSLGRRVALKLLRADALTGSRTRERFAREVAALSGLDHPGVCTVYEAGEIDGAPYIAMRLVDGETIAAKIARMRGGLASTTGNRGTERGRAWLADVTLWIEKVARAVHAAHEAGFVHRDIKPQNLMIDARGEPVVLDFGLARPREAAEASLTRTGEQAGTPAYMAPEQLDESKGAVDARTDVYALGATLYECVTLRPPFEAGSRGALFQRILSAEPRNPSRLNRHVGVELRVVMEKALAKDPRRRFRTADELADELQRIRTHEPIRTRPPAITLRTWRWAQRHPVRATALLALVLGLATSLLLMLRLREALRQTRIRALLAASEQRGMDNNHVALLLARAAVRLEATSETFAQLHRALSAPQERVRFVGHEKGVVDVAVSPNGARILTGSKDATARLWSSNGKWLRTFRHGARVRSVAFCPKDGSSVLTAGGKRVKLWRLDEDDPIADLPHAKRVAHACFLPDGRILTCEGVGPGEGAGTVTGTFHARLWSPDGRTRIRSFPHPRIRPFCLALAPDGKEFATTGTFGVRVFNVETGAENRTFPRWPHGENETVRTLAFSPDGDLVATTAGPDVKLWTRDGRLLGTIPDRANSVDISPSRMIVTSGMDGTCRIYDRHGRRLSILGGHEFLTWRAAFLPSGRQVVTASSDGTAVLWDLYCPEAPVLAGDGVLLEIDLSEDDRLLACRSGRAVHVWDWREQKEIAWLPHEHGVWGARFLANGQIATLGRTAVPGSVLTLWTPTGQRLRSIPLGPELPFSLSLSPDRSTLIASFVLSHSALPLDCSTATAIRVPVWYPTPSGDGETFLGYGDLEGTHVLRRLGLDGKEVWRSVETDLRVDGVSVSPDGRRAVVAGYDGNAYVWRLDTGPGAKPSVVLRGHSLRVYAARFSPSGDRVITASADRTARVFDLTGTTRSILRGHIDTVFDACISHDGRYAFTVSGDGTARVWLLDEAELLRLAKRHAALRRFSARDLDRYGDLLPQSEKR